MLEIVDKYPVKSLLKGLTTLLACSFTLFRKDLFGLIPRQFYIGVLVLILCTPTRVCLTATIQTNLAQISLSLGVYLSFKHMSSV